MRLPIALVMIVTAAPAIACAKADIAVLQANAAVENGYVRVVGEIRNGCSTAAAVQLQSIVRKQDGEVLLVDEFYPASERTIGPGDTYAFSRTGRLPVREPIKLEVKVIDVRRSR